MSKCKTSCSRSNNSSWLQHSSKYYLPCKTSWLF